MRGAFALPLSLALSLACKTAEPLPPPPTPPAPPAAPAAPAPPAASLPLPPGIAEDAMDPKADPCSDFYQYACGGWLARTEIPEDQPRWTRGFLDIERRNELILRDILEQAAAGKAPEGTPYAQKLGDFWATCMDEQRLEQPDPTFDQGLKRIAAVKDPKSITETLAWLHLQGATAGFTYRSDQDLHDATQMIGVIDQSGLGLPDRSYYVGDEPELKKTRDAYRAHMERMFALLGQDAKTAAASAGAVMELETTLARATLDRVSRRDPKKHDNPTDRKGLRAQAPNFLWDGYFRAIGTPDVQKLNVGHPPFVAELDKQVKAAPVSTWRAYLTWHFVHTSVPGLPRRFQEEDFQFQGKLLSGQQVDRPRWKKCVEYADRLLGHALGKPFVDKTFGQDGKTTTSMLVEQIEKAFERNLETLAWMDEPTRAKAREKIRAVVNKIGFPDQWRNYDALQTDRTSFLGNYLRGTAFERARDLAKIGKPLDRVEWRITPATVNAYYDSGFNEIVFPAGILQPPFFDRAAPFPVNFGGTGMVVGHEFTHGFDDSGRRFDAKGNLTDWWTPAADKAYDERAGCVKRQYDQVIAVENVHLNGALTLGENIADLGGLKLAHAAMQAWLQGGGNPGGPYRFNASQQFFLGYAQAWCTKYRPEFARLRAATDAHSPPFARVNEPLKNLRAFQEAFQCKEGSPMVRSAAERCELW